MKNNDINLNEKFSEHKYLTSLYGKKISQKKIRKMKEKIKCQNSNNCGFWQWFFNKLRGL